MTCTSRGEFQEETKISFSNNWPELFNVIPDFSKSIKKPYSELSLEL